MKKQLKVIISGGGTGGHIFPALAIANALKRRVDADILFIGAQDRMEMEKVPAAGYPIVGLPVAGFDRKNIFRNISVLLKLRKSLSQAKSTIRDFRPDVVVGVGGYASGPTLKCAQKAGIPTLLQEQNSFAGVTNKLLARHARKICVAYEGMERFFPADKIVLTGNPVRKDLQECQRSKTEALGSFGLNTNMPTVLVVGGSLGARTLNEALENAVGELAQRGVQVIWQTGKYFGTRAEKAAEGLRGVVTTKFITDMGAAYAAADLVVSRAGAGSISELELLAKPSILVPSPNVAEDHQTKNALALSSRGAAVLVKDADATSVLKDEIMRILAEPELLKKMSLKAGEMALKDSDEKIVDLILDIVEH